MFEWNVWERKQKDDYTFLSVAAQIHECPVCSDQSPVLGITGESYNLEKLCCAEGTVWVKYGLGNQGSVWTQNPEKFDVNEYVVRICHFNK